MSILARIFIAAVVCPGYGGVIGQRIATRLAAFGDVTGGAAARWEMTGLLAGGAVGLVFAVLTIVCVVGRGEVVRRRIADPVLICLSLAGIVELLARRGSVGAEIASLARIGGIVGWALGLPLMWAAARWRPPEPEDDRLEEDGYV